MELRRRRCRRKKGWKLGIYSAEIYEG